MFVIGIVLGATLTIGYYLNSNLKELNQIISLQDEIEKIIEKDINGESLTKADCQTLNNYIDLLMRFELQPIDSVGDRINAAIGPNGDCSVPFTSLDVDDSPSFNFLPIIMLCVFRIVW